MLCVLFHFCVYLQLLFIFSEAKPDNKADAILVWAPNPELKDPKSIKNI